MTETDKESKEEEDVDMKHETDPDDRVTPTRRHSQPRSSTDGEIYKKQMARIHIGAVIERQMATERSTGSPVHRPDNVDQEPSYLSLRAQSEISRATPNSALPDSKDRGVETGGHLVSGQPRERPRSGCDQHRYRRFHPSNRSRHLSREISITQFAVAEDDNVSQQVTKGGGGGGLTLVSQWKMSFDDSEETDNDEMENVQMTSPEHKATTPVWKSNENSCPPANVPNGEREAVDESTVLPIALTNGFHSDSKTPKIDLSKISEESKLDLEKQKSRSQEQILSLPSPQVPELLLPGSHAALPPSVRLKSLRHDSVKGARKVGSGFRCMRRAVSDPTLATRLRRDIQPSLLHQASFNDIVYRIDLSRSVAHFEADEESRCDCSAFIRHHSLPNISLFHPPVDRRKSADALQVESTRKVSNGIRILDVVSINQESKTESSKSSHVSETPQLKSILKKPSCEDSKSYNDSSKSKEIKVEARGELVKDSKVKLVKQRKHSPPVISSQKVDDSSIYYDAPSPKDDGFGTNSGASQTKDTNSEKGCGLILPNVRREGAHASCDAVKVASKSQPTVDLGEAEDEALNSESIQEQTEESICRVSVISVTEVNKKSVVPKQIAQHTMKQAAEMDISGLSVSGESNLPACASGGVDSLPSKIPVRMVDSGEAITTPPMNLEVKNKPCLVIKKAESSASSTPLDSPEIVGSDSRDSCDNERSSEQIRASRWLDNGLDNAQHPRFVNLGKSASDCGIPTTSGAAITCARETESLLDSVRSSTSTDETSSQVRRLRESRDKYVTDVSESKLRFLRRRSGLNRPVSATFGESKIPRPNLRMKGNLSLGCVSHISSI